MHHAYITSLTFAISVYQRLTNARQVLLARILLEIHIALFDHDAVLIKRKNEKEWIVNTLWMWVVQSFDSTATYKDHSLVQKMLKCLKIPGAWNLHFELVAEEFRKVPGLEHVTKELLREIMVAALRRFAAEFKTRNPNVEPPSGLIKLLDHCVTKNAKRKIVTSALEGFSGVCIPEHGLEPYFPKGSVIAVEHVEAACKDGNLIRFKPHPDAWLYALTQLDAKPNDHVLIVEDNWKNLLLAVNGAMEAGYTNVTGIIITRDGNTVEQTAALVEAICLEEMDPATRKYTQNGILASVLENVLIVDTFEELALQVAA